MGLLQGVEMVRFNRIVSSQKPIYGSDLFQYIGELQAKLFCLSSNYNTLFRRYDSLDIKYRDLARANDDLVRKIQALKLENLSLRQTKYPNSFTDKTQGEREALGDNAKVAFSNFYNVLTRITGSERTITKLQESRQYLSSPDQFFGGYSSDVLDVCCETVVGDQVSGKKILAVKNLIDPLLKQDMKDIFQSATDHSPQIELPVLFDRTSAANGSAGPITAEEFLRAIFFGTVPSDPAPKNGVTWAAIIRFFQTIQAEIKQFQAEIKKPNAVATESPSPDADAHQPSDESKTGGAKATSTPFQTKDTDAQWKQIQQSKLGKAYTIDQLVEKLNQS